MKLEITKANEAMIAQLAIPLDKSQRRQLLALIHEHVHQVEVILVPDVIDIRTCTPVGYHGAYSVLDIKEWATSDKEGDWVRAIIMEGERDNDEGQDPPTQVIIHSMEDGQERTICRIIAGTYYDLLKKGVNEHIEYLFADQKRTLEYAHSISTTILHHAQVL